MTLTRCLLAQLHQPRSPARQGKGTGSSSSSSEHTPHSLHACTRRCQNRSCLRCLAHGAWDSPPHLRHASRSIATCDPLRAPCTLGASYAPALLHVLPQRWSHPGQQPLNLRKPASPLLQTRSPLHSPTLLPSLPPATVQVKLRQPSDHDRPTKRATPRHGHCGSGHPAGPAGLPPPSFGPGQVGGRA